jgi:hypothetical protein
LSIFTTSAGRAATPAPVSGHVSVGGNVVVGPVVVVAAGGDVGDGAGGAVGAGVLPLDGSVDVVVGSVVVVVVVVVVSVVVVSSVVVVVALGSNPTPDRLTLKSSPSDWLAVSLMVKLDVSLNEPADPGENE